MSCTFEKFSMRRMFDSSPVPVSGAIDKNTRRKLLLSVPRALVLFLTVVPAVILKVTVASPESCHRSTDPPFPGVVAALSDLRQEIEKKTKAKLPVQTSVSRYFEHLRRPSTIYS